MKRGIAALLILLMVMFCFTGCARYENTIVLYEDGSGETVSEIWIEKETLDKLSQEFGMTLEEMGIQAFSTQVLDEKEYYYLGDRVAFADFEQLKSQLEESGYRNVYVSENGISYDFKSNAKEDDFTALRDLGYNPDEIMAMKLTVTMPKEIVVTTGTLSEDKRSAEFCFAGEELLKKHSIVVSCVPEDEETEAPSITGAKDKKTYNSARTLSAADESGISKFQYKYKKSSKEKYGKYKSIHEGQTFTENGTYYVRAYDNYGNKSVNTFTIKDTKKPKVTLEGKMNKKQTYYKKSCLITISDNCAVKSVKYTVNEKKVTVKLQDVLQNGITAEGEGEHKVVVSDVNGNTRTVTFKVK